MGAWREKKLLDAGSEERRGKPDREGGGGGEGGGDDERNGGRIMDGSWAGFGEGFQWESPTLIMEHVGEMLVEENTPGDWEQQIGEISPLFRIDGWGFRV
jgi:hypothetical protein